jgi:fluoroacetyl-CoA thioesterase
MKGTASIPVGVERTNSLVVTREMTVAHFQEHMPAVYGTPIMIYHMEVAAAELIQDYLPDNWVSVGVAVDVKHLAATPVGATVSVKAEVVTVDENTVSFRVEAHDGLDRIGEGTHVRAPVEVARFLKRVDAKTQRMDDAALRRQR